MRKEKLEELKALVEELKVVEVEKRKVEEEKRFLRSEAFNFKLNNGIIIPREKLIKGKNDGSAVIVMPITYDNEILTVIEPRVFTRLTVGVGFPAGYIEKNRDIDPNSQFAKLESDDTPRHAAIRELLEETGYVPEKGLTEIDSFYQDEGCSEAINHLFIAEGCKKVYKQVLDPDEVVKYMTFSYDELFELENMGYIKGCNSKLLLEKSKVYMKGR